jgi:hypothetical protein
MNLRDLRHAHKYSDVPNENEVVHDGVCSPCREGEATKLPFRDSFEHADEVSDSTAMWQESFHVSFSDCYQYIVTFADDNYRHISVAIMQRQHQIPHHLWLSVVNFKSWQNESWDW